MSCDKKWICFDECPKFKKTCNGMEGAIAYRRYSSGIIKRSDTVSPFETIGRGSREDLDQIYENLISMHYKHVFKGFDDFIITEDHEFLREQAAEDLALSSITYGVNPVAKILI